MKPVGVEAKLEAYTGLLRERAVPMGIVARSDVEHLRQRHVDDSLRALDCVRGAGAVADVGSGAGLPGIPLAIARPDLSVALIEARRSRVAFLELCVDSLELRNARVVAGNAEHSGVTVDACLCRAVQDAIGAWRLSRTLLGPAGWVVYFAGKSWPGRDEAALRGLGVRCTTCSRASFPWQGPVVRMAEEDLPNGPGAVT